MAFTELRVHGVSGTPPRNMLYTDPVTGAEDGCGAIPEESASDYTRAYRVPTSGEGYAPQARAFHWGGLTAGSWVTAFWILLGPFAFANVAGWVARKRSWDWVNGLGRFCIRGAGLGLTGLFTSQLSTAFVLIPYVWMTRITVEESAIQPWMGGLTALTGLVAVIIVWRFSTQSHFERYGFARRFRLLVTPTRRAMLTATVRPPIGKASDDVPVLDESDPAGALVTDPKTWTTPSIVNRLRRLHLGVATGIVSLSAASLAGLEVMIQVSMMLVSVAVIALVLTSLTRVRPLGSWLTVPLPLLGMASVLTTAIWIVWGDVAWQETHMHRVVFGSAIVMFLFAAPAIVAGWRTIGLLAIAALFGGVLGIATGLLTGTALSAIREPSEPINVLQDNGAGWVAVAMLLMIFFLAGVALALASGNRDRVVDDRLEHIGRSVVRNGHVLLISAGIYGLAAGVVAISAVVRLVRQGSGLDALDPVGLGNPNDWPVLGPLLLVAGALILIWILGLVLRYGPNLRRVLAITLVAAAVVAPLLWWLYRSLGLPARDGPSIGPTEVATWAVVLIPGGFLLRSIVGGLRKGTEGRRKVGILWDLGSFWPRWYQPLAPPAYGPIAVRGLGQDLHDHPIDVLGAHSQGSLIAAATLSQLDCRYHPKGFISYGSQLGRLYPGVFPDVGLRQLTEAMAADPMPDCAPSEIIEAAKKKPNYPAWINLWRDSDPIGGHHVRYMGDWAGRQTPPFNRLVDECFGHSGYERTEAYRGSVEILGR
jgi:hypothetical protein